MAKKTLSQHSRMVSGMTLISRITGLGRDMLMAGWLGNNWLQDCFNYAFALPNIFRNLLGEGALASSFIPVFSEKIAGNNLQPARELFHKVASLLNTVLLVLTLVVLGILALLWWQSPADEHRRLLLWLTALMFPYVVAVCLVALAAAVLNCRERFALPAFMPVLLNLFQMGAICLAPTLLRRWLPTPEQQVSVVAFSVLAAGVVQLLLSRRALARIGFAWTWDWDPHQADVRRIAKMMGPMVLGLGILQFGSLLDNTIIVGLTAPADQSTFTLFGQTIAYPLQEGAMSAVYQARRLYQFPLGVLGIALATVAFPAFSRLSAAGNYAQLGKSVTHALQLALFEAIPSGVGLWVLSDLIVSVILQHGRYSAEDTAATAHILRYYSLGMWAYCLHQIILRGFYSMKDTYTPLKVMAKTLTLGIVLDVVLIWIPELRAAAFGLSTSVVASLNVLILGTLLARRIGGLDRPDLLRTAGKTLLASGLMAAAGWWCQNQLPISNRYLLLACCMAICGGVFLLACRILKVGEVGELFRRHRNG